VLIIGGGVQGLMLARTLSLEGMAVTVVERGQCGQEASWAGGGILSPLYPWRYAEAVNALALWSQARYAALCSALLADTGHDPEYLPCGLLLRPPFDVAAAQAWAQAHDQSLQTHVQGAWMPQVAQVRNPRLLRALLADMRQRGVHLHEQCPVLSLEPLPGGGGRLHTPQGELTSRRVVVAAGAWSATGLLPDAVTQPAVRPIRGQMLCFKAKPGELPYIVLSGGRYLIPRRDGHILAGSTLEDAGFDCSTSRQAQEELRQFAVSEWPSLKGAVLEKHWAGLRPGAPGGVPYIGEHPQMPGVWLCTGHFRYGLVMAPASARLLADLMLGRASEFDMSAYSLLANRPLDFV
jgi:glycine oxidase